MEPTQWESNYQKMNEVFLAGSAVAILVLIPVVADKMHKLQFKARWYDHSPILSHLKIVAYDLDRGLLSFDKTLLDSYYYPRFKKLVGKKSRIWELENSVSVRLSDDLVPLVKSFYFGHPNLLPEKKGF